MKMTEEERAQKLLELKRKKLELLQAKESFQKNNILEYFNSPYPLVDGTYMRANPKQQMLLDAWKNPKFKVFTYTGANRMGKTFIMVTIAICTMAGKWIWDGEPIFFPHRKARKIRIIGQDWNKHIATVIIPKLHELWPKNRPVTIKKDGQGFETMWRDKITGSSLEIMSNKQESKLHEGWDGDLICYDEPPKRDVRVANARGLVDREGRELFSMTLLGEAWINQEVIKAMDENGRPDITVFNVTGTIQDNVGFGITQAGVEQFSKTLTEEEKEARLLGVPSYMSGLVYKDFKRETHLRDRFDVPLDWPVDIAIDTHPRKPHSVLFCATSPQGFKFLIHEIRMTGNGKQLAEAIVKLVNWGKYRVNRVICDPLAKGDPNSYGSEGMPATTYMKIADTLSRYDMLLETASKDKDTGILEVKKHLISDHGEPTLFIFNDLIHTIKEIEGLMWEKADMSDKEKVSKVEDDMMENLYRLILLNTEYTTMPYDDEDEYDTEDQNINETTGY
jgi:hypothetical protein